jgi:molecular chaperone DnaK
MTITGGSALSKDDIDKMIRDAEQYAEEDRQRRDAVEIRNQAESAVYSTEKFLADNADAIPGEVKDKVQGDVESLKKALEGDDTDAIKSAAAQLAETSQEMGTAMYAQAQTQQQASGGDATGPSGSDGTEGSDEDVVDAEIVDDEGEGANK